MREFDVVIVGGGLAGAATAWALSRLGCHRVLLLEQEQRLGTHASGRNAGMIRQGTEEEAIAPLAREGAQELRELGVPFRQTGSLLLGCDAIPESVRQHPVHEMLSRQGALERFPWIAPFRFEDALFTATDGVVDVEAFLQRMLDRFERSGGEWQALTPVRRILTRDAEVCGVAIDGEEIRCQHVVLAAGAWVSELAGACDVPVSVLPRRRHICVTEPFAQRPLQPDHPWVWDLPRALYVRSEGAREDAGLLWSACDSELQSAQDCRAEPSAFAALLSKATEVFGDVSELQLRKCWAGQRSFTADGNFLLGADARLSGLHWAAALGGHGVTVAAAVGKRVARGIVGEGATAIEAAHAFRSVVVPG